MNDIFLFFLGWYKSIYPGLHDWQRGKNTATNTLVSGKQLWIGLDNGSAPVRHQAIIWTNDDKQNL